MLYLCLRLVWSDVFLVAFCINSGGLVEDKTEPIWPDNKGDVIDNYVEPVDVWPKVEGVG